MENDDQGKTILVSIWTLNSLALLFLVARLGCKFYTRRGLWWDDWVMVMAAVCYCDVTISVILGVYTVSSPPLLAIFGPSLWSYTMTCDTKSHLCGGIASIKSLVANFETQLRNYAAETSTSGMPRSSRRSRVARSPLRHSH